MIGELFFGRMFGFMKKSEDHESYIKSIDTILPYLTSASSAPKAFRPFILTPILFSSAARKAQKATDHVVLAARSCVANDVKERLKVVMDTIDLISCSNFSILWIRKVKKLTSELARWNTKHMSPCRCNRSPVPWRDRTDGGSGTGLPAQTPQ